MEACTMHDAWTHTPQELQRHFGTSDMKEDESRIQQDMAKDIPRFYHADTDRARVLSYIKPRLQRCFVTWRNVGWSLTQAALALPYTTYARRMSSQGAYVVHAPECYHRTTFDPDRQTLVYSVTFQIFDQLTMEPYEQVIMHAAFGWSYDGALGPCRVMVHGQLMN